MSKIVGTNDPTLSDHLKAFIQTQDAMVVGIIGEGSSRELTALWESPFENDTPGSMFSKAGGIAQTYTGRTLKQSLNTQQVWTGTTPLTFALVLELYAVSDAYTEVLAAVMELEKAASPDIGGSTPVGRRPESAVGLSVGRQIIYPECVITNVSKQLDGPIGRNGHPLRGQVTLQLQTIATVTREELPTTFGS